MKLNKPVIVILAGLLGLSIAGIARAADAKDEGKPAAEKNETAPFKSVNVGEFEKLRADNKNVVLDVRTREEYAAGHIPGAVNIDVNAPDFQEKISKLDKNKTYLVHCAAGVRSARACDRMSRLDFSKLYNLGGGFRAWEKAGNKAEK